MLGEDLEEGPRHRLEGGVVVDRTPSTYRHTAVTFVAMIRSSVSRRVVNPSRGKPENADRVVFITTRSAIPASTAIRVSRPTATRASASTSRRG